MTFLNRFKKFLFIGIISLIGIFSLNAIFSAHAEVVVNLRTGQKVELFPLYDRKADLQADLQGDLALGVAAFESTFSQISDSELKENFGENKDIKRFYSQLFDEDDVGPFRQGKVIWIRAKIGGELVGWMTLYPDFQEEDKVYLSTLVVKPGMQNLGIGQILVDSITKYWYPKTKEIDLVVRKINSGAIRFYTRLGFVAAPEIHSDFIGNPRHCIFMKRLF